MRAPHTEETDDDYADYSRVGPNYQEEMEARILQFQNALKEMSETLEASRNRAHKESPNMEVTKAVNVPLTTPSVPPSVPSSISPSAPPTSGNVIRWDNIKPFPKNVAATKMWEAWIHFLEDFEIAASLSYLRDPKRRVELLLLCMGDELKSIVRAAKLRPSEDEGENYYKQFVDNIDRHLKAMTDPAAEHEEFSRMVQEEGESAVKYHARLTEKVLLCDYNPADQDRFVRTQLLRGLRNEELRRAARTYSHDSNTIVHAATRAEAFQAEIAVRGSDSNALVVSSNRFRPSERQIKRKQAFHQPTSNPVKRSKFDRPPSFEQRAGSSRRNRCSRCFRPAHRSEECPALRRNCNSCGERGHFAVACRVDRVSTVKNENSTMPVDEMGTEQVKK